MGNRQFLKYLVLLVASTLSGCTDENESPSFDPDASVGLCIRSVSVADINSTRAATTLTSGNVGVFCLTTNGYAAANNIEYTYHAVRWEGVSKLIPLNESDASLCAYYPYSSSITNATAVPLTSQAYASNKDLCYSPIVLGNKDTEVSFAMKRAYAKFSLIIYHGTSYAGACNISNAQLSNAGLNASASLNIITDTYSSYIKGSISFPNVSSIQKESSDTITLLMVPVTTAMTDSLVVKCLMDEVPRVIKIPAAAGLSKLEAGHHYIVKVNIGNNL